MATTIFHPNRKEVRARVLGATPSGGFGKSERPRLQIDFTPEAYQHLNVMKDRARTKSIIEVTRNALKLYDWYLQKQQEGFQFLIAKGDEVTKVELIL